MAILDPPFPNHNGGPLHWGRINLGYKIEEEYPPAGDPPASTIPPALIEAVRQLVGHWYENREAVIVGISAQELPLNVADIVREYRHWSW